MNMTVQSTLFVDIFALWPGSAELARDMRVSRSCARQWIRRQDVPMWYWAQLIGEVAARFEKTITYRDLVQASLATRGMGRRYAPSKSAKTRKRNRERDHHDPVDDIAEAA
jgi:hypothetical protein